MWWFVGALVILAVALLLQAGLVVFGAVALAVVLVLSRLWARHGLAMVSAERMVDDEEIEVGQSVKVEVQIEHDGIWPIPWILLEDLLPDHLLRSRPPRVKVKGGRIRVRGLRGKGRAMLEYKVQFLGRGFVPIGPLVLESGDVFGLHRRYRVLAPPKFVTVLPQVVPLAGYDIASRRPIGDVRLSHRLYEDPTRTAGVRPYQYGDPLNRIHWRATARTGSLHSRVFEPSSLAGATLLVNFHSAGYPERGEPFRSELVAKTAASLANAVLQTRQQVGLWSNGADAAAQWAVKAQDVCHTTALSDAEQQRLAEQVRGQAAAEHRGDDAGLMGVPTRRGDQQLALIRRLLARLELSDARPFPEFVIEVAPRLPHDATVLAVTTHVDDKDAFALANLKRQGFAVAAVVVAPGDGRDDFVARLIAAGVRDVRVLEDESELPQLLEYQARPTAIGLVT